MRNKKPSSMSVKEHIYRKLSQDLKCPLDTVKKVIDNQFRTALSALKDNNSLEIAGFGKIIINKGRLKGEIENVKFLKTYYKKLLNTDITPKERIEFQKRLDLLPQRLIDLNIRLKKFEDKK